jgi:hypothetical protein
MMARAGAILLIVIVLLQTAGKWLVMADYALNKSYIAAVLCENKNKTAMHCNGRCHLRKQLQKEESGGEKDASGNNSQQKFQEVFFEDHTGIHFKQPTQPVALPQTRHMVLYTCGYTAPVFHPPGC